MQDVEDDDHSKVPETVPPALLPLLGGPTKAVLRARLRAHDTIYSRAQTHQGNSQIVFYPSGDRRSTAVPGSIEYIFERDGVFRFAVRRYIPLGSDVPDPFARWPDFPAKMWSSTIDNSLEEVEVNWVFCQFAQYAVDGELVVVMLPRVSA